MMNDLEKMTDRLEGEGVIVDESILQHSPVNISGLYIKASECSPTILVNGSLSEREKRCVLAEEAGHHYRTVGNVIDAQDAFARKQEEAGRRWAYEELVPLDRLADICLEAEHLPLWDLAEALDVTEGFLITALNYYRDKYGCQTELPDGIIIQFEPYFDIYREDEN